MTIRTTLWRAATLLVVTVSTAHAQVDVYASADVSTRQPATSAFTQTATWPLRFEEASLSSRYAIAAARTVDGRVGLSRALTRHWALGLGVGLSRASETVQGTVTLSLPHPIVFNAPGVGTRAMERTDRRTLSTHLEGSVRLRAGPLVLSLFAGPSRMRVTHAMVSRADATEGLTLSQTLPYTVSISGVETRDVRTSAWGYHAGADVSVYPSRHLGAGGLVRYSRARATIINAAQHAVDSDERATQALTLGGLSIGAGVRVRF